MAVLELSSEVAPSRGLYECSLSAMDTPTTLSSSHHGSEHYMNMMEVLYITYHCRVNRWGKQTVRYISQQFAQYTGKIKVCGVCYLLSSAPVLLLLGLREIQ
jgi:hypothetical protein